MAKLNYSFTMRVRDMDEPVIASIHKGGAHTDYLFVPLGQPVNGAVRVTIATTQARPPSPMRHPKVNAALLMAHHFHPDHVVSVRLERSSRFHSNRRGREYFEFRVV